MGLDLGSKIGLVMWAFYVFTWHAESMFFEIASRGQMVSKEGLQNWNQFWVSIVFFGTQFWPPIPFKQVRHRVKHGLV